MHKYHTGKEYFWEDMQGKLTSAVALGGKRADKDLPLYKLHSTTASAISQRVSACLTSLLLLTFCLSHPHLPLESTQSPPPESLS